MCYVTCVGCMCVWDVCVLCDLCGMYMCYVTWWDVCVCGMSVCYVISVGRECGMYVCYVICVGRVSVCVHELILWYLRVPALEPGWQN